MGKLLKTRFSTAVVVLIPACIGMNYLGKFFATLLKLPLWLDSIGTCMGACLGGPIVGALCGAFNNLIYGLTTGDNITLIYSLTSAGIGFFVGLLARLDLVRTPVGAVITAIVAGLVAVCISTPLNVWGDALFGLTQARGMSLLFGSFVDEMVVDIPDKVITVLIARQLLRGLPKQLVALYDVNTEIERLD